MFTQTQKWVKNPFFALNTPSNEDAYEEREQEYADAFVIVLRDGATDILLSTCGGVYPGSQSQGRSLAYVLRHICDPQIHLWCQTCQLLGGQ